MSTDLRTTSPTGVVSYGTPSADGTVSWSSANENITDRVSSNLADGTYPLITAVGIQVWESEATATADGLTTGIIPDGTSFVTVTSANAAHIITLPTTVDRVGRRISGYVGANGFELKPAADSGINGGIGTDFTSAIGANLYWEVVAVSATQWLGSTMTVAGVKAAMAVSD